MCYACMYKSTLGLQIKTILSYPILTVSAYVEAPAGNFGPDRQKTQSSYYINSHGRSVTLLSDICGHYHGHRPRVA